MSGFDTIKRQLVAELRRMGIHPDEISSFSYNKQQQLARELAKTLGISTDVVFEIFTSLYGDPTSDAPGPKK